MTMGFSRVGNMIEIQNMIDHLKNRIEKLEERVEKLEADRVVKQEIPESILYLGEDEDG